MEINVKMNILEEEIIDVLTTALEGGSNYWYYLPDLDMVKEHPGLVLTERIIRTVLEDKSISIPVLEVEEKELLGYLNKQNIMEGIELFIQNNYQFDSGMDADDADILFQYIVMKEIVFG